MYLKRYYERNLAGESAGQPAETVVDDPAGMLRMFDRAFVKN